MHTNAPDSADLLSDDSLPATAVLDPAEAIPMMDQKAEFDAFASQYDVALEQGISASGENKSYFAQGRLEWLARQLPTFAVRPDKVLDFGCGTGSATPFLLSSLGARSITGVDVSASSLEVAQRTHGSARVNFELCDVELPNDSFDLAFCNGVFHHIPLSERLDAVQSVYQALRPGGLFAFWENNPWNPATRYVMSRIPFDKDAITLSPPTARRLLRSASFEVLRTDFLFIFPRLLSALRPLEPFVSRLPLGAQYQVLCRKPA